MKNGDQWIFRSIKEVLLNPFTFAWIQSIIIRKKPKAHMTPQCCNNHKAPAKRLLSRSDQT
jgi:hypothetical protein